MRRRNYTYRQRRWFSDLGRETTVVSFVRDGCGIGEAIDLGDRCFHAVYRTGRSLGFVWSLAGAKRLIYAADDRAHAEAGAR